MGQVTIPVDLLNPGQVFGCLGLLEAADVLCGPAEGGFDWAGQCGFMLRAENAENPILEILNYLAEVELKTVTPSGWSPDNVHSEDIERIDSFPTKNPDRMAMPIILQGKERPAILLSHWCDGSSRNEFKLYSGNRTAMSIASSMLRGTMSKTGKTKTFGVRNLWQEHREKLLVDPFNTLTAMGGSFNFDPRGAWTAIDAGYSPNEHKHEVMASPLVEIMAVFGLEHARPAEIANRLYRYAIWSEMLPPQLARAAMGCCFPHVMHRYFRFRLELSGKNKVVYYANEETNHD